MFFCASYKDRQFILIPNRQKHTTYQISGRPQKAGLFHNPINTIKSPGKPSGLL